MNRISTLLFAVLLLAPLAALHAAHRPRPTPSAKGDASGPKNLYGSTYYGYLYDEQRQSWRLYAAGQMGAHRGRLFAGGGAKQVQSGVGGGIGSFVEVPGAFNVEMSGDVLRTMARRVWFYGSDGKFYPVRLGGETIAENATQDEKKPDGPAADDNDAPEPIRGLRNAFIRQTADGWILNSMGGMTLYATVATAEKGRVKETLPVYLQPEKAKGLLEIPVTFGEKKASQVTSSEVTIDYQIIATGPHSQGILYYGPSDCNAHIASPAPQAATHDRTQLKVAMLNNGWKTWTPQQEIKVGLNQFKLKGLAPNTTYYFRLYVEHDDGRSWDYTSGKFLTAGTVPLRPAETGQPEPRSSAEK